MSLRTANTRRQRRERLSKWQGVWEITWALEAAEAARAK